MSFVKLKGCDRELKHSEKQGFLHGAAVLAASGIIVKVLGACFKIPIGAILKPEGMAVFSIAYNLYALLFVLSTAGVPVAVSKMIAHTQAIGRGWESGRIYRISLAFFAAIGAVASAVMYVGAFGFARMMSGSGSEAAIRAVAPAVFFVSVSAVSRGYYQGLSDMYPTAKSQVLEAFGKLAVGFGAAWFLNKNGFGSSIVAAGAVFGVSVGALLSAVYLAAIGKRRRKEQKPKFEVPKSGKKIISELVGLSVPITLGAAVISLTNVIDSALVMKLLQKTGYAQRESMWLYGAYSYACNLFNLPSALITTLGVSLIPKISAAYAVRNYNELNKTSQSAVGLAMLAALPSAAGLFVLAEPVMDLLYGHSIDRDAIVLSGKLLAYLAVAIPAMGTVTVTNAIHQACGNVKLPVVSMLFGAVVKLMANYFFVGIPEINIKGAAIGTILCYTVIAVVNCAAFARHGMRISFAKTFLKPAILALVTGGVAAGVFSCFAGGDFARIGAVAAVFAGMCACGVCALTVGAVGEDERKCVFKGGEISKFLKIH